MYSCWFKFWWSTYGMHLGNAPYQFMVTLDMAKYPYDCNSLNDLSAMFFDLSNGIRVPE